MKLSKAQQKVISYLKTRMDVAQICKTPEEWAKVYMHLDDNDIMSLKENNPGQWVWRCVDTWHESCKGISFISAKTETVNKLVSLGYIEVISPAWRPGAYEKVKLIKY